MSDFEGWHAVPPLFRSDNPTLVLSKVPSGIKLRSNSIDGEKVVLRGRGLLVTDGPQGIEAINPEHRTVQFPEWPLRVTGRHSR
jgi:hypothetical protein